METENNAPTSTSPVVSDELFQHLLSDVLKAGFTRPGVAEVASLFATEARKCFGISGVYCWSVKGDELFGLAAAGPGGLQFTARRTRLGEFQAARDAVESRAAVIVNEPRDQEFGGATVHSESLLVTPLLIGASVVGAVVWIHDSVAGYFQEPITARAQLAAAHIAVVMDRARLVEAEQASQQKAAALSTTIEGLQQEQRGAENLTSFAAELGSSLQLSELVKSITNRTAALLNAGSAALALMRGPFLETVYTLNVPADSDRSLHRRLNLALSDASAQHRGSIVWGSAGDLLGESVAKDLNWADLIVARIVGANDELIALLCLANRNTPVSEVDHALLDAMLRQASIALENSRLFSRISQANSHWTEIFDSISDFIVVHDHNSQVVRLNRSFADFVGARPAELIGASMKALMAIAQEPTNQPCPFCRAEGETGDEFIHPVLERTYLVSTSSIHAAATDDTHTVHVLKDITDRREAERRYQELFNNIQEGLFFSTPDGRFIEVNDALVRMLGYESREELLQVDIVKLLYASAEQREKFSEALESAGTLRNYEEALLKKDGSVIYTLQNAFAVRDTQNRIIQYRGLVLDITDLKNFQAELQRQRDFNLKILNNTQSLILVCDTVGLITYANRRCYESGGYRPGELVGRRLADLVASGRREALLEGLAQTISGMQVDNLELPLLVSGDRIGHFAVNLSPMRDDQGQVNSIVVVMTDITDAALLQAKLMHTEKMAAVGQLVSGVAHEVNNPLTAILGFADLLSEQPDVPEPAKRDLAVIIQEAQRTKIIVQNLLSFARQMPPQREPVQVNDIIRRTLQLRSYDFANRGVQVVQKLQEPLPEVVGDSHQLQQVFLNIVNNAYDAVTETGRAGRIEISTVAKDGVVEVHFADNGDGIAAPERIFDPFFTTKEVGKGTGLGLSICYGIVREHGGEITCFNRTDSSGAVFVVKLPLAAEGNEVQMERGARA